MTTVAVVTGGRGFIGGAIVKALKAQNVELVYAPSHSDMNVKYYNSVKNMLSAYGKIDLLVNCAGLSYNARFTKHEPEGWLEEVNVNLVGVMNCCHAVVPLMHGLGTIINIASLAGVTPHARLAAYSSAKAGVIAFSEALDFELALYSRIRVGCISPCKVLPSEQSRNEPSVTPEAVARAVVMMWNTPACQRLGHYIMRGQR